jgi:hypothetical protein
MRSERMGVLARNEADEELFCQERRFGAEESARGAVRLANYAREVGRHVGVSRVFEEVCVLGGLSLEQPTRMLELCELFAKFLDRPRRRLTSRRVRSRGPRHRPLELLHSRGQALRTRPRLGEEERYVVIKKRTHASCTPLVAARAIPARADLAFSYPDSLVGAKTIFIERWIRRLVLPA